MRVTVLTTPEFPCAFSPARPPGHVPDGPSGHASGAASCRYSVKFSVVPESSARLTAVTGVSGSSTPGFWLAMAGSFQILISPRKIAAIVAASRLREVESDGDR